MDLALRPASSISSTRSRACSARARASRQRMPRSHNARATLFCAEVRSM
ncbi:Uncharacterised protein [Bordetella pertussis]|nr:Uncharacterised protein [Bordetella pertussis]